MDCGIQTVKLTLENREESCTKKKYRVLRGSYGAERWKDDVETRA